MSDPATANPDSLSRIVMLAYGSMENGKPYWCYVAVKPTRYTEFQDALRADYSLYNFESDGYGEVVVSGEGVTPPQEVTARVAEIFGIELSLLFADESPLKTLEDKMGILINKKN